ncbi:MurR/RpiR family transcriptional regulator [Paenibacillus sp. N1-5-1-14]|uniref:MurR/RpiR family transcriptional regulator n=1 Tax=Paenibacillus radicibacter TaxID=2972488 RepID=UPI002159B010|nr:MurR/RpiR family transcriptional regulator [Paenibacillus radicibacter]MCR8641171.1 MurR/RpiR family transcriptional regulator [Paenibacillus radicibacter]
MMGSVLTRIQSILDKLSQSEQKIARYILDHPEEVTRISIHELAERTKTSGASVVRFCNSIQVEGFPQLKIQLSLDTAKPELPAYYDFEAGETMSSIIRKTVSNSVQALQDTAAALDSAAIEQIVAALRQAPAIYTYGIGASSVVADDIAQKWMRLGKTAFSFQDLHVLSVNIANAKPNSVFIGVSYSGMTKEVVHCTRLANDFGLTTVGISRYGKNDLSAAATCMLTTAHAPEALFRSGATSSRLAQLLAVDTLFFAYASSEYDATMKRLGDTSEAIRLLWEQS